MNIQHYEQIEAKKHLDRKAAWTSKLKEMGLSLRCLDTNDWESNLRPSVYVTPRSYETRYCPTKLIKRYSGFNARSLRLAYAYWKNN